MRHTLFKSASAVAIASILPSALAGVAPRQVVPSAGFTCTDDALYKGFFSNSQISYDVQTFCSSELGLSDATVCDHSLTARTTVYPSASYHTITTTSTTTSYDSTFTVTETGAVVLDMSKKRMARNVAPRPEAQITAVPEIIRKALDARAQEKRQGTSVYNANAAAAEVYSACECGYLAGIITSDTDYLATCFPYTTTVTNNVDVYQATTTTAVTTVEGAITTVTVVQNMTSNIVSVISAMNTSSPTWTGSWTGPWNGSWTGSWTGPWTGPPGTPTSSPTPTSDTTPSAPSTTTSDTTPASPIMTSAASLTTSFVFVNSSMSINSTWTGSWTGTWSGNWTSTESSSPSSSMSSVASPILTTTATSNTSTSTTSISASSSSTIQPSGCPYINGTTYTPPGSCNIYTRVCGLSFPDSDFYGTFPYFSTPEACAELCDADSSGMSPCLGIVWNTSAIAGSHQSNCRQLESLDSPIMDSTAIALILTGQDQSCNRVVNVSSSTTVSASMNSTIGPVSPTGTGNTSFSTPSGTGYTWSPTGTWNYTWSPTGTWNHTRPWSTGSYSRNYTHYSFPTMNSTTASPIMASTTSYSNLTTSMNSTSISITSYMNATSTPYMNTTSSATAPISPILTSNSSCAASTVTQYFGNTTVTLDQQTVTIFATNISTVTVTATETTTETDTLTTTETDVAVSTTTTTTTEIDTETDISTSFETDMVTTTDLEVSTSVETDVTTVVLSTTIAPAAPGRYAWHGVW